MKFLMWLVLAVLVVLALRKKSSTISSAQQQAPLDGGSTGSRPNPNPNQANQHAETMVCCEHCQVYVPSSEAVYRQQQVFCSVAHADLH